MSHQAAASVQRQHAPAVLAGHVQVAGRWGQPCRAYNVCIRPDAPAAAALGALQDRAQLLEPSLLRIPRPALHANLAWLLPVHEEFGRPKDEIWRQRRSQWLATLAAAAATTSSLRLTFSRLAATNSAVIIVADEPNAFTGLRRRLIPRLRVPGRASPGDLAHITLFRYARPPGDPAALLGWLAATECCLGIDISELLIIQERVFPCLDYEILHRLPLAPALPADTCEPVSLRARNERPGETSARQVKG